MKKALVFVCLSLLLLVACASKAPQQAPEPAQLAVTPEPAATIPAAPVEDQTVQNLEQSIADVDTLTQDLDMSSLDQLDADLAAIDSLELG